MHDRQNYTVDLLLLSVSAIWGFSFAIIKLVYQDFHPITFNAIRFLIATVTMVLLLKWRRVSLQVDRKDILGLLWITVLGNGFYQFFFVMGLSRAKAGNAGLIMGLTPIFAYLIGLILKRERFSQGVFGGILLSLTGVAIIVFNGSTKVSFAGTQNGDLLMLGSAFFFAWYSVSASRLLLKYGALRLTVFTMITGSAIMIPLSIPWLLAHNWEGTSRAAWLGLLFAALLALVYAQFVWAYALNRIGIARTALYSNITPIIAVLGAWALLGERPTIAQAGGAFLVLIGVFIVRAKKPPALAVASK